MPALLLLLALLLMAPVTVTAEPGAGHAYSALGTLAYGPSFTHFAYVNPDAPKGGRLRLARSGSFDSLDTLRYPGIPPADLSVIFDRLVVQAADEPASYYGLLAETIEVAPDLGWVRFRLRPQARWHDGRPVSAADVVFTFERLKAEGAPFYRQSYRRLTVAAPDPQTVVFTNADAGDRDFVGLVGALPVHPAHAAADEPLGSGPYRVAAVAMGRSLTLRRVEDYWGRDLPVNRGRWNFDTLVFDYYRDDGVALEAFLADQTDVRIEEDARRWTSGYAVAPVADGRIVRETVPAEGPGPVVGLVFNLRQDRFRDPAVRAAIALAYDFEWVNQTLFAGLLAPVDSVFGDTPLAARGPASPAEAEILAPFRDDLPPTAFAGAAAAEPADRRSALLRASALLDRAGFPVREGRRVDPRTGAPFAIEAVILDPGLLRVCGPLADQLGRLGIAFHCPSLEPASARTRLLDHQFDMAALSWTPSRLPGRAERLLWGSALADRPGSYALAGAKDAALDAAIEAMASGRTQAAVTAAARAFDRVLAARGYMVGLWRRQGQWIAHWDRFGRPPTRPEAGVSVIDRWWRIPPDGR